MQPVSPIKIESNPVESIQPETGAAANPALTENVSVATGDRTPIWIYVTGMFAAMAGLTGIILVKYGKNRKIQL